MPWLLRLSSLLLAVLFSKGLLAMGGESSGSTPDGIALPQYFQAEAKIEELVKSQQLSKCTGFVFLYSKLFELKMNTPSSKLNESALLLFGHGPSVASQGAAINGQMDALFGRLPRRPRPLPVFASDDRRFQEQKAKLLTYRSTSTYRADWLSTHGTHSESGPHQGWREGYIQNDYDRTGRHDHALFNAYVTDHFEEQAFMKTPGASALFDGQIRRREEELELRHVAGLLFQWAKTPQASLYKSEDIRATLDDPTKVDNALSSHASLLRKLESSEFQSASLSIHINDKSRAFKDASPSQQKLLHQKAGIERFLMSQTDIRANRIGRELSRQLRDKAFQSSDALNSWLHENLCDTRLGLERGLVKQAGPYFQN